jgi:hypothetical protein
LRKLDQFRLAAPAAAVAVAALLASGCGGGNDTEPAKAAITYTKAGKFELPKSIDGGLVDLTLTNQDKAPHAAQLVRIEDGHTTQEALKFLAANSDKTPEWIRAEGGPSAGPAGTASATVDLPEGKYVVTDLGGPGSTGPPATAELTVKSGESGDLPSSDIEVTGAENGKDKYSWDVSGDLKSGTNHLTFKSEGDEAIHFLGAFKINGKHSDAEIAKALESGGPPPYVDQSTFTNTTILDGGKSQVTDLTLSKPGTYVLFCPLTDRDGGKPHFAEGMIKQVTVG